MTQKQVVLSAFQQFGYKITLGEALKHPWGYKFASRCADLRNEGYKIDCYRGKVASDNLYIMQIPDEQNGQQRFI